MKNKKLLIIVITVITVSFAVYFLKDVTIERTVETEYGVYIGETTLFDSVANGEGVMKYSDGSTYTGTWFDGKREGYGEFDYFPQANYTGYWQNDLYNGKGILEDGDGVIYTGNFVDGELESGLIDDYIDLQHRGKIEFQREVVDFNDKIIGLNEVNSYEDLVEVFSLEISSGNEEFAFISENFYIKYEKTSDNEDFYEFSDDVDNIMFEKYSFIPNLYGYEYSEIREDDMYIIEVDLRDDITDVKIAAIHEEVSKVVSEVINDDMSDFNKIITLHDYLCDNITYTMEGTNIRNPYGALIENKAVCEGYAEAFSLLLNEAGISNYLVHGDDLDLNDNTTHVWNLVEFDGEYYHVDVTWDDPDNGSRIYYDYFGVNDEVIRKDHTVFRDDIPVSGNVYNKYFSYYSNSGNSTYVYYTNATYYGQINRYGLENGYGTTTWYNGDKHTGNYVNGNREGQGKIEFSDGDSYEGNFHNNEISGYGTYTWSDGYTKTQEW